MQNQQMQANKQVASVSEVGQLKLGHARGVQVIPYGPSSSRQQKDGHGLPFKGHLSQHVGQKNFGPVGPITKGNTPSKQVPTQQGSGPFQPNSKPLL